ncbi:MAG: histidinol-phosphate transaminase [Dehalococcoidia bacterium]
MTADPILKLVRPDILAMLGYEPIEPAELIAERLGIAPERIAKLDGNENPFGPSPRVIEALASFESYHRYPDPQQRKLRAALGEYAGVPPEHIVAGHGSDEIIDLLLRAVLDRGDVVIDCPPTFGMYSFSAAVCGGTLAQAPRRDDFTLDIDAVRALAPGAKVIFVASPNNPTGNPLARNELDALLDTELLVVVDEAYVEFAGSGEQSEPFSGRREGQDNRPGSATESHATLVPQRENLVVLRTFSKWAGLAGLRAGYGIMPQALARVLMHIKPPYTPNVAADVAMLASLEARDELMADVKAIVKERDRMSRMLAALEPLQVYPSSANFVLARAPERSGRELRDGLARRGLFVRYFDTPRLQDCLRISVGLPDETDRVVDALREELT